MAKKLVRLENQKMIGGVCAGLADYMDLDISLVRILFVAVAFITAILPMVIFYIIAWIVIPVGKPVESVKDEPAGGKGGQTEKKE
jgi:phage shock protein C